MRIQEARKLFKKNEEWIMNPNVKHKEYPAPDIKEDQKSLKLYFEEYRKIKGKNNFNNYTKNLEVFFKITFPVFVGGCADKPNGEFWDRVEAMSCFSGFVGSAREAQRYLSSVDNIHAYT